MKEADNQAHRTANRRRSLLGWAACLRQSLWPFARHSGQWRWSTSEVGRGPDAQSESSRHSRSPRHHGNIPRCLSDDRFVAGSVTTWLPGLSDAATAQGKGLTTGSERSDTSCALGHVNCPQNLLGGRLHVKEVGRRQQRLRRTRNGA